MPPPDWEIYTDSCRISCGGNFNSDWFYCHFPTDFPSFRNEHINTLELLTILIAARRWGHLWSGKHIRFKCDNMSAVLAVNKGNSRSSSYMDCLRELFWISVQHNFRFSAIHVRGVDNGIADMLSRLHEQKMFCKFVNMFCTDNLVNFYHNMSRGSFLFLQTNLK